MWFGIRNRPQCLPCILIDQAKAKGEEIISSNPTVVDFWRLESEDIALNINLLGIHAMLFLGRAGHFRYRKGKELKFPWP